MNVAPGSSCVLMKEWHIKNRLLRPHPLGTGLPLMRLEFVSCLFTYHFNTTFSHFFIFFFRFWFSVAVSLGKIVLRSTVSAPKKSFILVQGKKKNLLACLHVFEPITILGGAEPALFWIRYFESYLRIILYIYSKCVHVKMCMHFHYNCVSVHAVCPPKGTLYTCVDINVYMHIYICIQALFAANILACQAHVLLITLTRALFSSVSQ